jgi:predicted O-methyltransferase YrrM
MKLNLTKEIIENEIINSNFFNLYKKYYEHDAEKVIGEEHYPLFITIGKHLKNSKILEIGTRDGKSILSFSNGHIENNNKLYTYDINPDIVNKDIINESGSIFSDINLFDSKIRESNKEHILSSDIIFIDIDPHTGILELEMLNWLKENNYVGIIILDDIYLAKPGHRCENRKDEGHFMYQNLWLKIDDRYKKCISHLGHCSGTGLVCFDFSKHEIEIC